MIPPELIHLVTGLQSARINQSAQVEEVIRSLSPPMCYDEPLNKPMKVYDVLNSTTSLSATTSPPDNVAVSPYASVSPSPEAK